MYDSTALMQLIHEFRLRYHNTMLRNIVAHPDHDPDCPAMVGFKQTISRGDFCQQLANTSGVVMRRQIKLSSRPANQRVKSVSVT